MVLLIDATNIISGGGSSHLVELLNATTDSLLEKNKIEKIVVVGVENVTSKLPKNSWLKIINIPASKSNLLQRALWKTFNFNNIIAKESIDFIFNPGGSYFGEKTPYVTMCRNMLVFETKEADRFGHGLQRQKFKLLRILQSLSMKRAAGVIFISNYAQDYIKEHYPTIAIKKSTVINHGVSVRFRNEPRPQKEISNYSTENPYKILYVSILNVYKHHAAIAAAVAQLVLKCKLPLEFIVVGEKAGGFDEFEKIRAENPTIIKYLGKVPFEEIQLQYSDADLFVYGSTCENMPNILIEAMSSGLPVISSEKEPMPEFLKDGGLYFSVENIESIYETLEKIINNPDLRETISQKSTSLSSQYSWEKCAAETYQFLSECNYEN